MGSVSVMLVRPLVAAVGSTNPEPLLGGAGPTPHILPDADARVAPAQFCVAWSEAIRLTNDRKLALAIAGAMPPGAFGIVEYVCRSAPTLRAALLQWAFGRLF